MTHSLDGSALVWLRRDLRWDDHKTLAHALQISPRVYTAFVFDHDILSALPSRNDRRVAFIHASLLELDAHLRTLGGGLIVLYGQPAQCLPALAAQLGVAHVVAGRDYEPAAVARDQAVAHALRADGRQLTLVKDQVIFDTDEVLTATGHPFSVFTPYKNAWLKRLASLPQAALPSSSSIPTGHLAVPPNTLPNAPGDAPAVINQAYKGVPTLAALGFGASAMTALPMTPGPRGATQILRSWLARLGAYHTERDFPARPGTSQLSVHLRFGTVGIRTLVTLAQQGIVADPASAPGAQTWLSELIWREFYMQILHHHPRVVSQSFRPEYDRIAWIGGESAADLFAAWTAGQTGYPLVDAAIAQIRQTGYMHNRLRMVVASFLCKDLGLDWRLGERWFAQWLNDFDLAANNGGWQWASSSGCDAQPYFRIFNPVTQSQRFDPHGHFIRAYLPQLAGLPEQHIHAPWLASLAAQQRAGCVIGHDYPRPIVDHAQARTQTLARYAVVKSR